MRRPADSTCALWLSLCESVLFFSVEPGCGTPFAFIHLRTLQFTNIEPPKALFSIDGGPNTSHLDQEGDDPSSKRVPLQLVFLLPDGRWQSYDVQKLVLEVCDHAQMEAWVLYLTDLCNASSMMESMKM